MSSIPFRSAVLGEWNKAVIKDDDRPSRDTFVVASAQSLEDAVEWALEWVIPTLVWAVAR